MSDIVEVEAKGKKLYEVEMTDRGANLKTGGDLWSFASLIHASGMAPSGMNASAIAVAIQMGAEVGLPPMTALRNIAVINGRPTIWGDLLLALVERSGKLEDIVESVEGEGDKLAATCTVKRKGRASPVVRTFSMKDAQTAGLAGKAIWKQYPKRMLGMRARAFALRDAFPDALGGFLLREEVNDLPPEPTEATTGSQGLLNALKGKPEDITDVESTPVDPDAPWEPSAEELAEIQAREAAEAGLFPEGAA